MNIFFVIMKLRNICKKKILISFHFICKHLVKSNQRETKYMYIHPFFNLIICIKIKWLTLWIINTCLEPFLLCWTKNYVLLCIHTQRCAFKRLKYIISHKSTPLSKKILMCQWHKYIRTCKALLFSKLKWVELGLR